MVGAPALAEAAAAALPDRRVHDTVRAMRVPRASARADPAPEGTTGPGRHDVHPTEPAKMLAAVVRGGQIVEPMIDPLGRVQASRGRRGQQVSAHAVRVLSRVIVRVVRAPAASDLVQRVAGRDAIRGRIPASIVRQGVGRTVALRGAPNDR